MKRRVFNKHTKRCSKCRSRSCSVTDSAPEANLDTTSRSSSSCGRTLTRNIPVCWPCLIVFGVSGTWPCTTIPGSCPTTMLRKHSKRQGTIWRSSGPISRRGNRDGEDRTLRKVVRGCFLSQPRPTAVARRVKVYRCELAQTDSRLVLNREAVCKNRGLMKRNSSDSPFWSRTLFDRLLSFSRRGVTTL